jgi:hypothetical protein
MGDTFCCINKKIVLNRWRHSCGSLFNSVLFNKHYNTAINKYNITANTPTIFSKSVQPNNSL